MLFRDMNRWNDTCRVAGMYAGKLNMFHYGRNKCMGAVADSVCLTFQCMIQKTVNQNRPVRCDSYSGLHISGHAFCVIYDFHSSAAQYIGGTDHYRISDPFCNDKCFLDGGSHTGFRHGNTESVHHGTELITVFSQVNDRRRSAQDTDPVVLKF